MPTAWAPPRGRWRRRARTSAPPRSSSIARCSPTGRRGGETRPAGGRMSDALHDAGMAVRREVLGDAHVDRAIERTTELTAPFQDYLTRCAWGSVWTREGLDRRTRSAITLAALVALRAEDE